MYANPAEPDYRKCVIVREELHPAVCPKCGHCLHHRNYKSRSVSYACVKGPDTGCGGVAIRADLLEEYVTGAVSWMRWSPRACRKRCRLRIRLRRAELLALISRTEQWRAEARRDYSEGVIDRADWLDIRAHTEEQISAAARVRPARRLGHGGQRHPGFGAGS